MESLKKYCQQQHTFYGGIREQNVYFTQEIHAKEKGTTINRRKREKIR